MTVEDARVDIRIVTLPLINGEGIVMRILDTQAVVRDLSSLGMDGHAREEFVSAITQALRRGSRHRPDRVGEVDDAVRRAGHHQRRRPDDPHDRGSRRVAGRAGSSRCRSRRGRRHLRHRAAIDSPRGPDVIMVGEIRDQETAQIAVQAALTGHLVLSTLHTRDAPSAITRLIDMGIEPFLVSAAIDCVVAQRLARTLCVQCKQPAELSEAVRAEHGLNEGDAFEPVGCIRCGWTGYDGRVALYEVMPVGEELRAMILDRRGPDDIAAAARRSGMKHVRRTRSTRSGRASRRWSRSAASPQRSERRADDARPEPVVVAGCAASARRSSAQVKGRGQRGPFRSRDAGDANRLQTRVISSADRCSWAAAAIAPASPCGTTASISRSEPPSAMSSGPKPQFRRFWL